MAWLAISKKGLSDICVKCRLQSACAIRAGRSETTLYDSIRFCAKVHNLKFDEYDRKFSKRVQNTVGKGEIARYEQFLLFPQCFQNACTTDT